MRRVMLDHLSIQCADPAASAAFYDTALTPLGYERVMQFGDRIGYGSGRPYFWIGPLNTGDGFRESHIAFGATDRAAVHAFFDAATGAGAEVLHEPRLGRSTTRPTSVRSCATPTATTSRPCATNPSDRSQRMSAVITWPPTAASVWKARPSPSSSS